MNEKGSISRLFCAHWGERSPPSAARRALEATIPGFAQSVVPVDVGAAAKYVGIDHVVDSELTGSDGLLSATPSGTYIATLRKGQSASRKRFTLAHEIGHAIVFRSVGLRNAALDSSQLRCKSGTADEREEERLCDIIAAELLMPRQQFAQVMDRIGVSASTIPEIAQLFGVSLQATCRKVAQILPYEIAISLWMTNEQSSHFVPKWYVTKNGARAVEHTIAAGDPGSACFVAEPVRGWHWIPLHGQMDKYFVDVSPLRSSIGAWLLVAVFGNAAQHIISTISKGTSPSAPAAQIPLLDE
jgi:hypothetical protein